MNNQKPDIYKYSDVKKYLRDYRDYCRTEDPGFSNTYICFILGQEKSHSYFNNVIAGRVRIGPTILERFKSLLNINRDEFTYFRHLVAYSQAQNADDRDAAFIQMVKTSRVLGRETNNAMQSYYGEWYVTVVRALLDLIDFDGNNYEVLLKRMNMPITLKQLKQSIQTLINLELVKYDERGMLKPAEKILTSGTDIDHEILIRFQEKTLNHSRDALRNPDVKPQKITSMTLSVSKQIYREIERRVDELRQEIRALAAGDSEGSEELVQLIIHLYPHTGTLQ